ncbi:integrase [Sulfolobus sp. S-194]|nr:integrase [Sulfolobus sp. S-194]
MGYRVFSAGQYKIRQRDKKYYVYSIEKDSNGNVKETYIGPLDKIVKFYCEKGLGPGFEPGTSGSTDL